MKKTYQILSVLLLTVLLSSCGKDSPFNGTDNRLLSLNLTVNTQEYKGVISPENTINIYVPIELDLNNANVAYTISEQACILPDPVKITDWNNDQVFNVISYNGEKRTYIVRILRQKATAAGDILLATDEDVKTFAEKGISKVEGNLIIGRETGTDSVSNIDALTYLIKVNHKIIVNPTYKGRNLSGLRNLNETGSILLNDNKFIKTLTLKSLRITYGDIVIKSDTMKEIHLPVMTEIRGGMHIETNGIAELDFPELQKAGDISIKGYKFSAIKVKRLNSISGNLTLDRLPALKKADFPKLQTVTGNFKISNLTSLGIFSLPVLKTVNGNFSLENSSNIAELYLPALENTKEFKLHNNKKLSRILAPKIREAGGDFIIHGSPLKNLEQIAVENVGGKISISNLTSLQSLSSFFKSLKKAETIEIEILLIKESLNLSHISFKNLNISNCSNLSEILLPQELNSFCLKGVTNFRQEHIPLIKGLKKATDFSILNVITEKAQDYTLSDLEIVENELAIKSANIHTLKFPVLKSVKGKFSIPCIPSVYTNNHNGETSISSVICPSAETITSLHIDSPDLTNTDFPNLTTVETLKIVSYYPVNNNSKLTHMNGIKSLNKLTSIEMVNLKAFTDYSFLKTVVENGSLKEIKIKENAYNPTMEDLKRGLYVKP